MAQDKRSDAQQLEKKSIQIQIAEQISQGLITGPDDLVKLYNVKYHQAVLLLSSPNFIALVSAFSKAKTHMAWHAKALPRIIEMIDSPNPELAMKAMKLLGQITEAVKGADININFNLEQMVKQYAESSPHKKAAKNMDDTVMDAEYQKILNEE